MKKNKVLFETIFIILFVGYILFNLIGNSLEHKSISKNYKDTASGIIKSVSYSKSLDFEISMMDNWFVGRLYIVDLDQEKINYILKNIKSGDSINKSAYSDSIYFYRASKLIYICNLCK